MIKKKQTKNWKPNNERLNGSTIKDDVEEND